MKIEVKNLGPIKEGTISLDSDLILLTGPNNSGKSYLAYLVYGIMAIDNRKVVDGYYDWSHYMHSLQKQFSKNDSISIEKLIKILNADLNTYNLRIFSSKNINPNFYLKNAANLKVELNPEKGFFLEPNIKLEQIIWVRTPFSMIAKNLFHSLKLPPTFFYPAERTAINMLAKEVYREKSIERDELAHLALKEDWEKLKELTQRKVVPRYPLAINDYIGFVYDLENTSKNESEFASFADEIEELLLKGKISLSEYGDIRFMPTGTEEVLEIHVSSSLVKSLSGLILYLRHSAKKGDLIIIDEPELNLHPDNQRLMARVLARMVNKGFKLMVSTHSDYIIRQLNNLIMLHNSENEKAEELRKYYGYEEEDTLDFNRVVSYFFNGNSMQEIAADEKGIDIPSIDTVVNDLNNESQDIYFSLYE
ncbi:MAG: AAA family ATPase [Chitinophagales bacterium]